MTAFTVSAKLTAEAAALLKAAKDAIAALDNLAASEKGAAAASEQLNAATEKTIEKKVRKKKATEEAATADRGAADAAKDGATAEQQLGEQAEQVAVKKRRKKKETDEAAVADRGAADAAKVSAEAERSIGRETEVTVGVTGRRTKATKDSTKAEDEHAKAIGFTKNQMLTLKYTASDIVASLASGASPMMILMQQGPQVAQAFDSPREAITKLGALFTPLRLLIGGVSLAAIGGIAAYESYAASVRQVDIALAAHGNRLGLTSGAYQALASDIAAIAGVSERSGREIAAAMIAGGAASEEAMTKAAEAARGYGIATGKDATAAAIDLAAKLKDPAKAARELSDEFNLLDEATIRQIESAQRSGDQMAAQKLLTDALDGRFASLAGETSGWARSFEWLGTAASNAWNAVGNFMGGGPGATLESEIADLKARRDALTRPTGANRGNPFGSTPSAAATNRGSANLYGPDGEVEYYNRLIAAKEKLAAIQKDATAAAKAEDERTRRSREVGAIDARVNPQQAKLRGLDADEKLLRGVLNDSATDPATRLITEKALNGVLRERKETLEQIAKQGVSEGDKEAARLAKRAAAEQAALDSKEAAQRRDLDLQEQIFVARVKGDDALVRSLEAQREAARQGFDIATGQGSAMAEMEARAAKLEAATRAFNEVQGMMGRLDPRFTPGANQYAYEADIKAAEKWRDATLRTFDGSLAGAETYAANVDVIFNDTLAKAYDDDLRRRTDWAAGVERGYRDLQAGAQDFASTAENGLVDAARSAEDAWVKFVKTGKLELNDLLETILDMAAKLAYQQFLAPGINAGLNWLIGGISSLVGGAAGQSGVPALGMGQQGHTGMIAGGEGGTKRQLPASTWLGAPRFHLGSDEVPAILQKREGVFTPRQMDNADMLISAIANRPIFVDLGKAAGWGARGGDAGRPNVTIYGAPEGTRTKESQREDGGWNMEVFLDQAEDRLAGRVMKGTSPVNQAMESTYQLGRAV